MKILVNICIRLGIIDNMMPLFLTIAKYQGIVSGQIAFYKSDDYKMHLKNKIYLFKVKIGLIK